MNDWTHWPFSHDKIQLRGFVQLPIRLNNNVSSARQGLITRDNRKLEGARKCLHRRDQNLRTRVLEGGRVPSLELIMRMDGTVNFVVENERHATPSPDQQDDGPYVGREDAVILVHCGGFSAKHFFYLQKIQFRPNCLTILARNVNQFYSTRSVPSAQQ